MKIIKNILIVFLLFSCIFFVGCKDKNLTQMPIMQDIYKTGGNLTFNYDEISHVATFGGEGEVIQYYQKDIE